MTKVLKTLVGLQITSFILFNCHAKSCRHPYVILHGLCLYKSSLKKDYCGAQDDCNFMNGELITGDNVRALKISDSFSYFIGMSDLLDETASLPLAKRKTSFRWTDGSFGPDLFLGTVTGFMLWDEVLCNSWLLRNILCL